MSIREGFDLAFQNRYFRMLAPLFVYAVGLTNSTDALTTLIGLGVGLHEENPTSILFIRVAGTFGWLLLKFEISGIALLVLFLLRGRWATMNIVGYLFALAVSVPLTFVFGYAALHNAYLILRTLH